MKKKTESKKPKVFRTRAEVLQVRLTPEEKETFVSAAEVSGVELSAWVREKLRKAAIKELEEIGRPIPFLKPKSQ
ncbi:DUF1778 domain-containing protein [Telmatocola sphagniphila]|uniref:DUF1778 domain-containing protein n=1 Tax=Telmatocola sphagniphila TaxID=1123043 RepID=A0A8E6B7B2_9BACT|nr:DUF1778 domain-containing protein [Telmatocola sphagniphila]QVL33222.1 DUF1778 domain-containing protein [Telmatocola sphagniphila]